MTSSMAELIAVARSGDPLGSKTRALLLDMADALEAEHQRAEDIAMVAENHMREVLAERDALRTAAQTGHNHVRGVLEKLDSYSWHAHDSGFVASTRMSALSGFEALSRAIDTKEPELDDMTKADVEQEERDHTFGTDGSEDPAFREYTCGACPNCGLLHDAVTDRTNGGRDD